ncbi:AMP-binding protein [Micromonospora sp. RTP1Z1]|uniref:AMP-binding protein n=1 Tax=Micromonospora sp. RTP1Z1 TaxID=2994043 RepID=UPI0029C6CE0A|nr:AMP-binding protein [Micromonospora sp. RTP1Z1]
MTAAFATPNPLALQVARQTLDKLRRVPALADRYADIVSLDSLEDLIHVPVMRKDDLNVALDFLKPRAHSGATWTFQSGGSTGEPKLGYAPSGLYMDEVYAHWRALDPDDIFVNGWGAGKLWGAHYLMAAYADLAGCTGIGLGAVNRSEYDAWLDFFATRRVTAFGGTPSVLRPIFGRARDLGIKLPDLRKVLWLGEAWNPGLAEDLPAIAPGARRWGLYGSTETWVAGTNTPECAADVWHPLPSQLIHIGSGQLLDFTSLKPHGLNPVLRYQTGDAGEWVPCTCGSPDRALRVLGRRDGEVKFRGLLLNADAVIAAVAARPEVSQVQLLITEYASRGSTLEVLVVPARDAPADVTDKVREHILSSAFGGPSTAFHRDPEALEVRLVEELIPNERTGKTSGLIQRRAS